jgi:mRNA export factor
MGSCHERESPRCQGGSHRSSDCFFCLHTRSCVVSRQHDGPIKACVWVPERGFLATASWDKTIKYWDTRSPTPGISVDVGERVYAFDVRAGAAVACLAEGSYQGSAAKEKRILMYDLTNPAAHLRVCVCVCVVSPCLIPDSLANCAVSVCACR